jgi:hypothetical protein
VIEGLNYYAIFASLLDIITLNNNVSKNLTHIALFQKFDTNSMFLD